MDGKKVLIVDDDEDVRASLKVILERREYTVSCAGDREAALQKAKHENPDLLILDVMMAGWSDGFEISRDLKGDEGLKDIPILMLTGVKSKTGIDFKSSAGDPAWLPVDGYLEKPVTAEALLAEVQRLLPVG
ncbi:response regulator [Planctomycetota bacterium]